MNLLDEFQLVKRQVSTVMIPFRQHELTCQECLENRFCDYGLWLLGLVNTLIQR
jgi:hypothetical protein